LREIILLASNYSIFVVSVALLAGMQASLWMHVFGFFPAPYLWIAVVNYWTLYRSPVEAVIMNYLITFCVSTMSGAPLSIVFASNLTLFATIYLLRDRVLWSGPNSFMFSCGLSALILPMATFLWSQLLEQNALTEFYFFDWLMRSLLTAAFSLPTYYVFVFFDRLTQKEPPTNTESEVL
jgi:hypothetical protein